MRDEPTSLSLEIGNWSSRITVAASEGSRRPVSSALSCSKSWQVSIRADGAEARPPRRHRFHVRTSRDVTFDPCNSACNLQVPLNLNPS